ncbi:MAG: VCBS repeat-containing protein, partial [Planctomycetes bacterium]|nr:VCBS repeat-containing protein [Planctomycetota bacterium]
MAGALQWNSPNRYRLVVSVDPRGVSPRSHSPIAPLRVNFAAHLLSVSGSGRVDPNTIEVMAYDTNGNPHVYDASRPGYEQYLLPWRIDSYYRLDDVDLVFVMPNETLVQYAVYFDTQESGRGRPDRYAGIVGDGDLFRQQYGRREIGPSKFGDLADFDGDGDPDLFEGGVEPFIYCHENLHDQTGEHQLVPRGRLTSDGQVLMPSRNLGSNRAWMSVTFYDWDKDGDPDLFSTSNDGPDMGHLLFFRNNSVPGGRPQFTRVDRMLTVTGQPVGGGSDAGWFPTPTFIVDWDGTGDGLTDILMARGGFLYLYRNLGPGGTTDYRLANGVRLQAGGVDIELLTPRVDCADLDGDGDLDLLATTHGAAEWANASVVYWYKNVGTRQAPQFAAPVTLGQMRHYYGGLKVGDFRGSDNLLDIVAGTFWKVNAKHGLPKSFGGLLKNNGPLNNPAFELVLADAGAMYTEEFQTCDAGQQNGVRVRDLDNDGDLDLVASTTDGLVLFFRNLNNNLYPVFAPPVNLMVGGPNPVPVEVSGPEGGYARLDLADWNNDGRVDLLVADEEARVWLFLDDGAGNDPPTYQAGTQVYANGRPIDGLGRGSVLVCDWNNDGKKDLIMGMAPKGNVSSPYHDWPYQDGDNDKTDDEGFLYYRNTGTDASPVLAYPSWVRAGGQIIKYTRPNLGSFVDWDTDGKKDFIGCEFEGNVRFYRNTGTGQPNTAPTLSPAAG